MNEFARLKWQCRRGTKELDLLFNDYLDRHYLAANETEKNYFLALLNLEDSILMAQYEKLAIDLNQSVNS